VPLPDRNHIHTLELGSKASPPLVLVHGLGAGAAAYAKNLLPLSQRYHVYAIDLLGFAASSRPDFASDDPDVLEGQFLTSIDQWRQAVGLSRFVLLGHSFGGYLVTAYAMRHPEQIRHLVLADPWGFPAKPTAEEQEVIWQRAKWRPSFALRTFIGIMSRYPPYASMRWVLGEMGG
jgi:pimeloyl-ACP methyl ester carboxylesterase